MDSELSVPVSLIALESRRCDVGVSKEYSTCFLGARLQGVFASHRHRRLPIMRAILDFNKFVELVA